MAISRATWRGSTNTAGPAFLFHGADQLAEGAKHLPEPGSSHLFLPVPGLYFTQSQGPLTGMGKTTASFTTACWVYSLGKDLSSRRKSLLLIPSLELRNQSYFDLARKIKASRVVPALLAIQRLCTPTVLGVVTTILMPREEMVTGLSWTLSHLNEKRVHRPECLAWRTVALWQDHWGCS